MPLRRGLTAWGAGETSAQPLFPPGAASSASMAVGPTGLPQRDSLLDLGPAGLKEGVKGGEVGVVGKEEDQCPSPRGA